MLCTCKKPASDVPSWISFSANLDDGILLACEGLGIIFMSSVPIKAICTFQTCSASAYGMIEGLWGQLAANAVHGVARMTMSPF
jgi:hypothetical protein